jgi:predicted SAM-dependent methyltransferase
LEGTHLRISKSLKRRIPESLKPTLRIGSGVYKRIYIIVIRLFQVNRFRFAKFKKMETLKLNVGCGKVKLPGWVNIDIEPDADLVIDVRKSLPFDNNSVGYIYNEHVLEHFTYEEGDKVLKEFERSLKPGGVLRIATPDLDYIIEKYSADWKNEEWLSWAEFEFIKTRGQMLNICFSWWGHKYLYNEEDLRNKLIKTGFRRIVRSEWNKSKYPELSGLETRKDSKLILEAEKE